MGLQDIIKFIKLTHDFQKVERMLYVKGDTRYENDAEHSYQLAMVGWYIVSSQNMDMNAELVIKYGMLHDLVEVYAGDTYIYDKDQSVLDSKVEREHQALERLKVEFTEFQEMTDLITNYEKRQDVESQFIYALDKIIPPINIYLDGGRTWQDHKISFEQIVENKTPKVAAHPEIKKYFEELIEIMKQEQQTLFPENHEEV